MSLDPQKCGFDEAHHISFLGCLCSRCPLQGHDELIKKIFSLPRAHKPLLSFEQICFESKHGVGSKPPLCLCVLSLVFVEKTISPLSDFMSFVYTLTYCVLPCVCLGINLAFVVCFCKENVLAFEL